jgi:GTP pyrophosphokinase
VDTVRDCYAALGIIHEKYKPIPGRFKDYIAMPKTNMYQSLHTTLIGPEGRPFEIQIRTFEMHRTAEYGIAAHWKYKEGGSNAPDNEEEKLNWLRQILEWQTDTADNREFLSFIKTDLDLFSDQVYCFTPSGDVKNLPKGSTPIDFAYSIHTAVGNKMIGARVNGRQVPIETELKTGDRVEIITSQNAKGPSMDWLNVVKSTQAKTKINQWFRQENKDENIQRGKDGVANYCKSKSIVLSDITKPEYVEKVLKKYNFATWDALMASIGHGGLKEGQVVNRLLEEYRKDEQSKVTDDQIVKKINDPGRKTKGKKDGIIVQGMDDVAVRFSKCCAPVPGDEIVGYITRGRGVSIHRTDCVNILCMDEFDRARLISAEWSDGITPENNVYTTEINIYANDRNGLILDLTKIFNEANIKLTGMNVRVNKQGKATVSLQFEIHSKEQLNTIISRIRNVEDIIDIERTTG